MAEGEWASTARGTARRPLRSRPSLAVVASEQRGLVTRAQCLAAGLRTRRSMAAGPRPLRRVQHGVYLTTPGRDDWWTGRWPPTSFCGPEAAWSDRDRGLRLRV